MEWTDDAILLTVARAGKRMLILEVLTENYGRRRCVTTYTGSDQPMLLPGSFLTLTCTSEGLGKPLSAKLSKISGGIIAEKETDIGLVALSVAKDLLVGLLPIEQPAPEVYEAMKSLMVSLMAEDGRWPAHYAAWEFVVLTEIGHVQGIGRCMPAFRHGEALYVSPRTGALVTREEGGAFLDRLMPLPGFLLGGEAGNIVVVRQALEITTMLLTRFAMPGAESELPPQRAILERLAGKMQQLPPPDKSSKPVLDEEARKARLEAMRPLTVASRSVGV